MVDAKDKPEPTKKKQVEKFEPLTDTLFNKLRTQEVKIESKKIKSKTKPGVEFTLSYISWTDAWDALHSLFRSEDIQIDIHDYPMQGEDYRPLLSQRMDDNGVTVGDVILKDIRVPYLETKRGVIVSVTVKIREPSGSGHWTSHNVTRFCIDTGNRDIKDPSGSDIQDNISRAFAKCCALHGLGLHAYQGEDLPRDAEVNPTEPRKRTGGGANKRTSTAPTEGSSTVPFPKRKINEKQEIKLRAMVKDRDVPPEILGEWMAETGKAKFIDLTNEGMDHLIFRVSSGKEGRLLEGQK